MRFSNGSPVLSSEKCAEARRRVTVLVVEDDDVDFTVILDLLGPSFLVERAVGLEAAQRRLREHERPVDLIILDLLLEDGWPTTTFNALATEWGRKPIIVVTGCSRDLEIIERQPCSGVEFFDKNTFDAPTFLAAVDVAVRLGPHAFGHSYQQG